MNTQLIEQSHSLKSRMMLRISMQESSDTNTQNSISEGIPLSILINRCKITVLWKVSLSCFLMFGCIPTRGGGGAGNGSLQSMELWSETTSNNKCSLEFRLVRLCV